MDTRWKDAFGTAAPWALLSVAVTGLRLAGELLGWSGSWFSRATSGLVPVGAVSWVVGITWLALPTGAYLAWRLQRAGAAFGSPGRAVVLALAATVLLYAGTRLVPLLALGFAGFLLATWTVGVLAAVVAWRAWPSLGQAMLAYGLLSRLVVVVVMFLALRGNWGTHYDYVDTPQVRQMPFWIAFLALAFVPQLVFWVAFTVVAGILAGTLTAAVMRMAVDGRVTRVSPADRAG
jgi:hypothetical protein